MARFAAMSVSEPVAAGLWEKCLHGRKLFFLRLMTFFFYKFFIKSLRFLFFCFLFYDIIFVMFFFHGGFFYGNFV